MSDANDTKQMTAWKIENVRRIGLGLEVLICEWCGERTLNRDMVKRDDDSICQDCAEQHSPIRCG